VKESAHAGHGEREQRRRANVRARSLAAGFVFSSLFGSLGFLGCGPSRGTVGALLGQRDDGRLFVRETPKNLAAERAGLKPGDEILLIDGRDVRRLDPEAVHRALSGEVREPVKLTVLRGERLLRVTLRRTEPPAKPPKPATQSEIP
jgi:C-terminal processing protease CtpA/Prc